MNFVQPNYTVRATSVAQPHTSRDPFDFSRSRKLQKPAPDNSSSGYGSLAHLTDSQQNSQLQDDFMNKSEFNSVRGVSHSVTSRARNGPPQPNGAQGNGAQEGPRGGFMSLEEECNWILSGREPVMQDGDDYSDDGTWEWMNEIAEKDPNVKIYRNEGPNRLGHTILYDTLVNNYATNDIVMIYHADMYACPGMDEAVLKYLIPGTVVSATRIEPPLHPDGPEKVLRDYGIEPEEFDELQFLRDLDKFKQNKTTEGVFAPWAIYKDDYWAVGGHDKLFAPQSKEDSDIFNRFVLAGYELKQTWKGFVYLGRKQQINKCSKQFK